MRIATAAVTVLLGLLVLPETAAKPLETETARLRAHFDAVDAELRGRDVSELSAVQRARRAALVDWLREYRHAGLFPLNSHTPDRAVPVFRDDRGVLCAMAYLINRSGRGDIVDRVARERNYAYIPELADDRDLVQWLDESGLTVAEAARIQPAYGPCGFQGCPIPPPEEPAPFTRGYAVASGVTGAASLTTIGLNLVSPSRNKGWAGVFAGGIGVVTGISGLNHDNATTRKVATANAIGGSLAIAAGARALWSARRKAQPSAPGGRGTSIDLALTGQGVGVRISF